MYTPIHVGRAISKCTDDMHHMIGDDTGDNISDKNPMYCEVTAQYWAWKNLKDVEYIGLCHYRRYFGQRVTNDNIEFFLSDKYDVMLAKKQYDYKKVLFRLILASSQEDLYIFLYAIKKLYPEYLSTAYNPKNEKTVLEKRKRFFRFSDYKYWKIASIPIIFFSLEEGLRWGRFIDWCAYYDTYYNGLETSKFEFLFKEWWGLFHNLNIPYSIVIMTCSLLFILSLFIFFKPYANLFSIFFPVLISFTALSAENFIRWYVAFSVILVSFRFFLDKKFVRFIILASLVPFLHVGIVPVGIIMILSTFWKYPISPLLVIFVSLAFLFLFQASFMLNFIFIVDLFFGNVEKFSGYMNNLDGWLTGIGQNSTMEHKSIIIYIISMLPLYCVLYTAYKLRDKLSSEFSIMYNLGAIGVIFLSISSGLELIQRYAETYYPFLALLIACVINFLPNYKHMNIYLKKMIQLICYVFIVYKFILFIQPLSHEAFMCYVWNYWLSPQATFNLY